MFRKAAVTALSAFTLTLIVAACSNNNHDASSGESTSPQDALTTATPIKHLVVIYGENISFDHYFATYPNATNPDGETSFTAASGTPTDINTLEYANLLTSNPNSTNTANGDGAADPFRLDVTQAATADQNHAYTPEEEAADNGAMDLFPLYTGRGTSGGSGAFGTTGQVMGYYDGNTVTALWNLAQGFSMSDNAFSDTYGPSTPGALEAIAGQTNGVTIDADGSGTGVPSSHLIDDGQGGYTLIGDIDPTGDVCSSSTSGTISMQGKNIGDLLNDAGITWGSFMGGFDLTTQNDNATTGCSRSTYSDTVSETVTDYIPHHAWFQYYASTLNADHTRPSSTDRIGYSTEADGTTAEPANHEYDVNDFYTAVKAGNFPSVAYLKAPAYQDAHAGYSDPVDEQAFVAKVVNFIEQQPDWSSTAIIVAYDDSDGWYDHSYAAPTHASYSADADALNGASTCGSGTQPNGVNGEPVNGRCGPGTRIPFLVISPWARVNYVGHTQITQASIVKFIEDNWLGGERIGGGSFDSTTGDIEGLFDFSGSGDAAKVWLDPSTGAVLDAAPSSD
ncbi:phospholipase C [Solimonas marina]|uniref:Alkaline phosphatase family protein n=1 Tax=Solimonas marina TaxID=2714601 RepID=A0A969WH51_9GAMM|nr:alkaline phosphatase family protein [Solimonas marina]NKF24585.1 alkaline phosphatase family protein [Solimonas marina]